MRAQSWSMAGWPLLLLAACGEPAVVNETGQGSTTPPYVRAETSPSLLADLVQPVRVGELGPSFAACNARGATRDRVTGGPVPVRAAPFEQSDVIAQLAGGSEFFICSRTNDQRWFGIVYDEGGRATDRCGVSNPIPSRRNYQGPCAAGWIPSASVRLISGVPHQLPVDESAN
ncbi:SH3 domain-containing protein [Sphingosinicella terrae]|jgi:hypothetical protein|uniref:SH3 domain-containing protein n=1 Tax=Sphingosinicella terrae TaxID=2172047 RepID=UPI0013B36F45|nr:SH3 domain-containing protein [Sphingosinicella terrae]